MIGYKIYDSNIPKNWYLRGLIAGIVDIILLYIINLHFHIFRW